MKRPLVWIDMDDTVCNYKDYYEQMRKDYPSIEYPQSIEGFFLNLEPIPKAIEIIELLTNNFEVKFATRPSYMNPLSYTEKRQWIEKYFGLEMCKHLNFITDKSLIYGDYLIDDNLWKGFNGKQIQFGVDTVKTWDDVYSLIMYFEKPVIKCSCPSGDFWWAVDERFNCNKICDNKMK